MKLAQVLRTSGGIAFLFLAVMKGHSVIADWSQLNTPDPVLLVISSRALMIAAIVGECLMSVVLLGAPRAFPVGQCLLGFCLMLGYYRFSRWMLDIKSPCGCLGKWLREWGVSNRQAEEAAVWTLAALALLGGLLVLLERPAYEGKRSEGHGPSL